MKTAVAINTITSNICSLIGAGGVSGIGFPEIFNTADNSWSGKLVFDVIDAMHKRLLGSRLLLGI